VWITMLALMDRDGIVSASVPGLSHEARVDLDLCKEALERLMSPDEHSRTPDYEGRRIAPVDGGWKVLNSEKYRQLCSADDRREKTAERVRRYRERKKEDEKGNGNADVTLGNADVTPSNPPVTPSNDSNAMQRQRQKQRQRSEADPDPERDPGGEPDGRDPDPSRAQAPVTPVEKKPEARKKPKAKPKEERLVIAGRVWEAYSAAYKLRYGTPPVRNALANTAIRRIIERLGAADAEQVVAHYVSMNKGWYVKKGHALPTLLVDAETVRTEWATGSQITDGAARASDRRATTGDVARKLRDKYKAEEDEEE